MDDEELLNLLDKLRLIQYKIALRDAQLATELFDDGYYFFRDDPMRASKIERAIARVS